MSKIKRHCGHQLVKGMCLLLCNDWCDYNPGYCYLKIFDEINRQKIMHKFGKFPRFDKIIAYVQLNNCKVSPFTVSGDTVLHVFLETMNNEEVFECEYRCSSCDYVHVSFLSYYSCSKLKCKRCKNNLDSSYFPVPKFASRALGALSLEQISNFIDDLSSPYVYEFEGKICNLIDVERIEDDIIITKNDEVIRRFGIQEQSLRSIRHDYIASELLIKTDMKLSTIGVPSPEGNLTPDFIDVINKNVIELGTCNSQNKRNLESMYEGKRLKYKDIIDSVSGKYGIMIVGINKIFSNIRLTTDQISKFISRFLEATQIESKVISLCGFNVFSDNSTDDYKLAKLCFEKISMKPLEDKQYNLESLMEFDSPIKEEERKQAYFILSEELKRSRKSKKCTINDFNNYVQKFHVGNSRSDQKRVCNFPMVLVGTDVMSKHMERTTGDEMPSFMQSVWQSAMEFETAIIDPLENHFNKKSNMFKYHVSNSEKIELAKVGIGAKEYDTHNEKVEKEMKDKLSFHPDTEVCDIHSIFKKPWFDVIDNHFISNDLQTAVTLSKKISTNFTNQDSINIWNHINSTVIISFSYMMSYIFTELAYNYKHWTPIGQMIKRKLKYGITLLIYNPKSHIFVSYSIPKENCTVLETGKIGPKLYDCGDYYVSDFCSYNEPTIEHFLKAGPYISSLAIHLQSVSESNPMVWSEYTKQCLPNILLLYLNNKTDTEELVTSQRYLFMNLLEDINPNPWLFVDRLPDVMRSRLTVYYLQKIKLLMMHYARTRICKIPTEHNGMIIYDYSNVKSLFYDGNVSLHTKINEFYFGYVISKERGRGGDRMFKVLSKIIEHEYMFRDSDPEPFTSDLDTPKFSSNKSLLKLFSHNFSSIISDKLGSDYHDRLYNDYLLEVSYTNFNKLATLKASARDHDVSLTIPQNIPDSFVARQIQQMVDKQNPNESCKRPKMIEAIISLVDQFRNEKSRDPAHVVELLPWCLDKLIRKQRIDSDCFAKPQHGGDREIHVLEVSARIVQYHVELFSRVVCKYFPSETTCNPDTKESFVKSHYSNSAAKFDVFQTHSKSADASKWCQAHHTSHFSAMLMVIAPPELRSFLITALSLWPRKCLNFPTSLASSMIKNIKNQNVSPLYKRFRDDFYEGKCLFKSPMDSKMEIKSGMFQGILHTTSSLYHTMIQECMKVFTSALLELKLNTPSIITVVQGSDDSGMMISLPNSVDKRSMRICKTLLSWKENVATHLSVYTNRCKSSIGTHDLIEYNSEWHSRHKIIKPTIRWISACLEASMTERFIDRFRIFNGVLSQCLEGGASTLECSVIQLNQCCLHYMLMGFQTQPTSACLLDSLLQYPDPAVGFFPCDFDITAGVVGVEFQLYSLYQHSSYGASLSRLDSSDSTINYIPENCPKFLRVKDYQNVILRFCNMKIYNSFLSRLPIESYETAIQEIEDNPLLVFGRHTSWKEDQPNLTLKVHSQGVKESISNVSPALRMMASSVYLQTTKCLSMRGEEGKFSLLELITFLKNKEQTKTPVHKLFPLHAEFDRVYKMILSITDHHSLSEVVFKRTSKSKVLVFERANQDFPVIELCKRQWFGLGNVPLSASQFSQKWHSLTDDFPFLSHQSGVEGLRETCSNLNMTVVECKNLIESLSQKTRSIVLYDSNSKSRSLTHSISRIYWPNTKILHPSDHDKSISSLRSKIFSLVSYWCNNRVKEDTIKTWLIESEALSNPYDMLPVKSLKLKIFRDYLNGSPKTDLISKIISLKQGVVGYFPMRQRSKGLKRSGKGTWLGQVCGTDVYMELIDNKCTLIKINHLRESLSLSKNLFNLINEFKAQNYNNNVSGMFLNKHGTFEYNSGLGIPVIVDNRVKFDFANMMEVCEWKVDFTDFNLRLKVLDRSGGSLVEHTILSESFTSTDWIPDTPIVTPDRMLYNWSLGEPCVLDDFKEVVKNIPSRYIEFQRFNNVGKHSKYAEWNFLYLKQTLEQTFHLNFKDDDLTSDDVEYSAAEYDALMGIAEMDFGEDIGDLEEELVDWNDNVVKNVDEYFCFENNGSDSEEGLIEMINMMQHVPNDESVSEKKRFDRSLPYSMKFFSFLNSLAQVQYNKPFTQLYYDLRKNSEMRIPGMLGKVYSILLNRYVIETDLLIDEETLELDIDATRISDSVKTNEDLLALDLNSLKLKLEMIRRKQQIGFSHSVQNSLSAAEEKLVKLIEMRETDKSFVDFDLMDYDNVQREVMKLCLNELNDPISTIIKTLPDHMRSVVFDASLTSKNEFFDSFPDMEKQIIRTSINNRRLSSQYIILICKTFNVNFKSAIYDYDDGNDITLKIKLSNDFDLEDNDTYVSL